MIWQYKKTLGFIFLFLVFINKMNAAATTESDVAAGAGAPVRAATAAGATDTSIKTVLHEGDIGPGVTAGAGAMTAAESKSKEAFMSDIIEALKPPTPPKTPAAKLAKGEALTPEETRKLMGARLLQLSIGSATGLDSIEEVPFNVAGTTISLPVPTLKPLYALLAQWHREGVIPVNPRASVRDNFIGMYSLYGMIMARLQKVDKDRTLIVPPADLRQFFTFAEDSRDEAQVVLVGANPIATVQPLIEIIASWAPSMPLFNVSASVEANFAALYEALRILRPRYSSARVLSEERCKKYFAEVMKDEGEAAAKRDPAAEKEVSERKKSSRLSIIGRLVSFMGRGTEMELASIPGLADTWDGAKPVLFSPARIKHNLNTLSNVMLMLMDEWDELCLRIALRIHEPRSPLNLNDHLNPGVFGVASGSVEGAAAGATVIVDGSAIVAAAAIAADDRPWITRLATSIPILDGDKTYGDNIKAAYRGLRFLLTAYNKKVEEYAVWLPKADEDDPFAW